MDITSEDLIGAVVTDTLDGQWLELTLQDGRVLTVESLNGADLKLTEVRFSLALR